MSFFCLYLQSKETVLSGVGMGDLPIIVMVLWG